MNIGKPTYLRRFLSGFIDLVLILLIMFLSGNLILSLIYNTSGSYGAIRERYQEVLIESTLYEHTENGISIIQTDFDEHLTYCFTLYDKLEIYQEHKNNSEYFMEDGTIKEDVNNEDLHNFYLSQILYARTNLFTTDERYKEGMFFESRISTISFLIGGVLSCFIFQLLIPLISKNGKTIGKRITRLSLVSASGYQMKKWQLIPRFIIYCGATLLILIDGVGIYLFMISFMIIFLNRRAMAIHDYISYTAVVDFTYDILPFIESEDKKGDRNYE